VVLDAAGGRLQNNARQWARLLAQSTAQRLDETRRAAARPALRRRLGAADADAAAAAQRDVQTLLTTPPLSLSVELWSAGGERLAAAFAPAGPDGPGLSPDHAFAPPKAAGMRPLQVAGDLLFSETVVDVASTAEAGSTPARGFLVIRRRTASPAAGQAVARLIGAGHTLRIGSRESGVWTDLGRRVEPPPAAAPDGRVVTFTSANGTAWLGTEAAIAGMPWTLWVETPQSLALAPATAFWNAMLPIGAGIVVLGAFLAWLIGRRITAPLTDLTHAAEALAAGDLSQRVRARRTDEVGRLADAFNTMADQVQSGYTRLDTGIRERTAELEQTLTTLRETQEQLVRREKLAMLGQLASGVGHELRNPLGVMANAVYYLDMVQTDAPSDVQEYHGILRAQIGLAEKIVGDLLDFSRLRPPRRDIVSIAELVAEQRARLALPAGVTVRVDLPADLPVVGVDAVQIGQIVFNLLMNAVQVLEERGGTITVSAAVEGTALALHVSDDGPGVPADLRAKIFEPLFTTKARGIGLGLAVSRSLAESNGGALVLGDAGGGARFTLTMPLATVLEPV
jgi:signal transduction histidine kinase